MDQEFYLYIVIKVYICCCFCSRLFIVVFIRKLINHHQLLKFVFGLYMNDIGHSLIGSLKFASRLRFRGSKIDLILVWYLHCILNFISRYTNFVINNVQSLMNIVLINNVQSLMNIVLIS